MRGRHTLRVIPKVALLDVTFGPWLTVAHHHVPGQSLSSAHPKSVQNAVASVGLVP